MDLVSAILPARVSGSSLRCQPVSLQPVGHSLSVTWCEAVVNSKLCLVEISSCFRHCDAVEIVNLVALLGFGQ